MATWRSADAGERLLERGQVVDHLGVIVSGRARAELDGREVAQAEDGRFLGALPFFTGEVAPVDVFAETPTRYVTWEAHGLREFLKRHPELMNALQLIIGQDISRHLKGFLADRS
jgi:CRP-like cAMP-binding protein